MSFDEWEAMPLYEQRHRLVLHLARQQMEKDEIERMQRKRFEDEMKKDAAAEAGDW